MGFFFPAEILRRARVDRRHLRWWYGTLLGALVAHNFFGLFPSRSASVVTLFAPRPNMHVFLVVAHIPIVRVPYSQRHAFTFYAFAISHFPYPLPPSLLPSPLSSWPFSRKWLMTNPHVLQGHLLVPY